MEQAWVVQQFRDRTGGEFLTEIARIVLVAQGQALSRVSQAVQIGEYSRPVAKDMFPYERRSRVETNLHSLDGGFPGVQVSTRFNQTGNAHTVVTVGPALLTSSYIRTPLVVPRPARFRERYARLC